MRDEKLHTLWREAHLQATSEKAKSTSRSEHFLKLRCRKSACCCGVKHISKSKRTKHTILGPLLEVEMSKKCTPLWREENFEVKCTKHTKFGALLEVEMWKSARRCGAKQISKSTCTKHTRFGALLEVEMSKKRTLLWCEAHFEVNMLKTPHVRTTF